jgi:hypothetical protein
MTEPLTQTKLGCIRTVCAEYEGDILSALDFANLARPWLDELCDVFEPLLPAEGDEPCKMSLYDVAMSLRRRASCEPDAPSRQSLRRLAVTVEQRSRELKQQIADLTGEVAMLRRQLEASTHSLDCAIRAATGVPAE